MYNRKIFDDGTPCDFEYFQWLVPCLEEKNIANKLMDKIEKTILRLEKNPYSCPEIHIKPHNEIYRKLVIENYIVLYEVDDKQRKVIIYRVVYGKTDYLKIE